MTDQAAANLITALNPNQNPESSTLTYTNAQGDIRIKDLGTLLIHEPNFNLIEVRPGSIPANVNKKDIIFSNCSTTGYLNDNHSKIVIHRDLLIYIPVPLANALGLDSFEAAKIEKLNLSDTKKYFFPNVACAVNHYNSYVAEFEKGNVKCHKT